jgi:hypothetical protein
MKFIALILVAAAGATAPKLKYGPEATPLSVSHEYFRSAAAPDFWALSPYYTAQQDDRSCSLASVCMILNAARAGRKLTADDELVTQKALLKKVDSPVWKKGLGPLGRGVTLQQLGALIRQSLAAYELGSYEVEVVHVEDDQPAQREKLHRVLVENERSASDFLVLNFLQGAYTGDASVGHIAPAGAYDEKNRRVLVLDPDRQWYEPYWVSEETLLKGMATPDKESGRNRGYVWVKRVAGP